MNAELNSAINTTNTTTTTIVNLVMRAGISNLNPQVKQVVAQQLLQLANGGKLPRSAISLTAAAHGVSPRTISRLWSAIKRRIGEGMPILFEKIIKKTRTDKMEIDSVALKAVPLQKRGNYRSIARELHVSKSLVAKWFKEGGIRAHTNAIKPELTTVNKLHRLHYSISSLRYDAQLNIINFKSMNNVIHIDEKWFYITRSKERYYLLPDEPDPYISRKSKRFITKLMFICAVARPQYSQSGECIFNGKIGIFPFTKTEPALRNSKNRVKGTLETKPIAAITKQVTKDYIISKVLLAIRSKWPAQASKEINIQQDNAKPHIKDNDPGFRNEATKDGFNFHLVCQPANSPDTNILDLGFFRAIQSLQYETPAKNVQDLIANVVNAYDNLPDMTLNKVFLSLQGCMVEILKCKGHNNYKVPHMYKDGMITDGLLPDSIAVDESLVKECLDYIRDDEHAMVTPYDVQTLGGDMGY